MNGSDVFNLYIAFLKNAICSLFLLCATSFGQKYRSAAYVIDKTLIVGKITKLMKPGLQRDYATELLMYTRLPSYFCIVFWERNKPCFLNHGMWGSICYISSTNTQQKCTNSSPFTLWKQLFIINLDRYHFSIQIFPYPSSLKQPQLCICQRF